jgi:hypothetical protein
MLPTLPGRLEYLYLNVTTTWPKAKAADSINMLDLVFANFH